MFTELLEPNKEKSRCELVNLLIFESWEWKKVFELFLEVSSALLFKVI